MKHHAHKILAFAAVALLLSSASFAQEKKIEVINQLDSYSLVRETNRGLWLVSNYFFGQTVFSMVDETQPATQQLWLGYVDGTDSLRVNDFEIFRDTVYFCGQVWRGKTTSGIWGYFPLNNFPNVTVSYNETNTGSFSRLDVFSVDTTTIDLHVAMVGSTPLFYSSIYIYDEVRTAPGAFDQYKSSLFDFFNSNRIYDVESTDNMVALSTSYDSGSVFFFDKPIFTNTTFLSNFTVYNGLSDVLADYIRLEYCTNNSLVAVYQEIKNGYFSYGDLHVHSFTYTTPHAHISIDNTSNLSPLDVKFNKADNELDILAAPITLSHRGDSSMIFHLVPSLAYNGGWLFCHKFMGERLNSLAWLSTRGPWFVASGHDETQKHLRLYKYCYTDWGYCSEQVQEHSTGQKKKEQPLPFDFTYSMDKVEMAVLKSYPMGKPLKIVCPQ